MHHDVPARLDARFLGLRPIVHTRVGNMKGAIETTVLVAAIEDIISFRSFVIALPGLWPQRVATEGDSVLLQNLAMVQQNQRAFFLQDEHLVGACIGRESVVGLADCKQNCNYHE